MTFSVIFENVRENLKLPITHKITGIEILFQKVALNSELLSRKPVKVGSRHGPRERLTSSATEEVYDPELSLPDS